RGQMTSVALAADAARKLLREWDLAEVLDIAAWNSPRGATVVGPTVALSEMEARLRAQGTACKRLDVEYPFHSPVMEDVREELFAALCGLRPGEANIPFYSSVSGASLPGEALAADYWWANIRDPVRFQQATEQILADGFNVFVELGGHPVLRGYLQDGLTQGEREGRIIATLQRGDDHPQRILAAVQQVFVTGVPVAWSRFYPKPGPFVDLPHYPWERERYWHPVTEESAGTLYRYPVHPLLGHPVPQHEHEWEQDIDTARLPFLADHRVGEGVIFPGAGYVELFLAAARQQGDESALLVLEDLEIWAPLSLNEESGKVLRVTLDAASGEVQALSRDRLAQDWTLHAKARIVAERKDLRLRRPALERPEGAPDFDGEQHYRVAESVGLLYGPNFRTVTQGWVRGDAVWAAMALPSGIATSELGFHLHPALLDGAFQLFIDLLHDNIVDHPGVAFVPIRMGRITLRQPLTQVAWAGARLLRRSPHSILAEFTLMDAAGTVVALCEGVRMRQVKLLRTPDEPLRLIATELVAMPRREALQGATPLPVAALAEALQAALGRGDVQHALDRYRDEYAPLLDALLQAFLSESGGEAVAETMPAFADEEPISAGQIWMTLIRDYPEFSALTLQVGSAGLALAASSADYGDHDRAAAPRLDPDLLVRTILQTVNDPIHAAVTRFAQERCAQLAPSSRLGIMEINAHGPDWIVQAAEALSRENCCDLYYASPGAEILESQAETAREAQWQSLTIPAAGTLPAPDPRPTVHFAWVQVDGMDADSAAQMIHMARDCLAPQGLLFLLGVHPEPWMTALAECRDADAGQSLTAAQLQADLPQMGFVDARLLGPDNVLRTGPYLLLARKSEDALPTAQPEPGAKGRWLLVGEKACGDDHQSPWTAALELEFAQQGFKTITLEAANVQELENSLRVLSREEVDAWEGVLYFPGLFPAADEMSMSRLLGEQCQSLRALSQWALGQEEPPSVWVLTRHGLSALYPSSLPPAMTDGMAQPLHGAGLTGFARTLQNELPELALRVLDLTESEPTPPLLEHLVRECVRPDSETEIVLDGHGGRYVPRVREKPALEITARAPRQLRFAAPGQLRNLHWARFNPPDLAEDDVEVLVSATGLNFRDVMYALGMLSDEALENGFSGPGLGLEFAGTVSRVGSGVYHVAPGDEVLGFAPASFATHVVTKGYAVTRRPEHLGVEAAATMPTAFLTAWYALMELARLQPGERVLIHGGAGGVGIAAIQMAQWRGAEVYATVGSPEKRDFLRLLGVPHLYHSRSYDFAEEIWRDTNQEGVDVVLNSLSGEAIRRNLQILRPFGRFLELGKRDFYENTPMALRPFRNNLSYFGIDADQLMQLRPTLTQEMFGQVMGRFAAGDFFPLPYTCFPARSVVSAFRYMQQARQIGKIVVTMEEPPLPVVNNIRLRGEPLQLAADGVYLVTGGLSGFGLETARRLAERGARKLVLISRSGRMDGHAREAMVLMRSWGVEILALRCDVTDRTQLADLFARIALELGPLRGVIHAAAVIDDALAQNLSEEQIQRVLAPKVQGALHLHHLTQTLSLDFFVLYSSVTTILGNPGQAHYVAANTWMEALAQQRRAQGLPATAILWGAIGDVGFLARNKKTKEALQQRLGSAPMSSQAALDWLEEILARDVSGDAVVDWDWRAIRRFLPIAQSPRFSPWNLAMGHGESTDSTDEDLCGYLLSLPNDEAVSAITDLLRREVAEILRLPMEKIEATQSLSQIGLDSLMGVELALALEQRLGVKLPSLLLAEGPTPAKLADRVLQELRKKQGPGEYPQVAAIDEEELRRLAGLHGVEAQAPTLDGWVMNAEGR
nr:SDR family NAD(P)-dependent oxidoreductase [Acidithiobacillus ferridurans]